MQFSLLGFPTRITGSFLLTVGAIGFLSFQNVIDQRELLLRVVAFVAIASIAVLVHELGHAFAAKSQGAVSAPSISLEGMAGLTRYRLAKEPGRAQSIFISFAGPLAGIVLGVGVLALSWSGVVATTGFGRDLVNIGLFTTFGWSAFNLLPIVPLDGGHIMTDLLPGDRRRRHRSAAVISIVFAVVIGALLWWTLDLLFAPIILGFMAFQNFSVLQNSKAPVSPR